MTLRMPCVDSRIALLTRHGKGPLVAPALAAVGLSLVVTDAFDTDQLGTFAGEVERTLSPLDCARRKARLACELTGFNLGLGSEGSFGGGPLAGLVNWNVELLLLWDRRSGQEVVAQVSGPVRVTALAWQCAATLEAELAQHDPGQSWIIRHPRGVCKGLLGSQAILQAIEQYGLGGMNGPASTGVVIEPDLRAMHCPERQVHIRQAGEQLAQRLQSPCSCCAAVDFWPQSQEAGLPCGACGAPTPLPLAAVRRCGSCGHEQREPGPEPVADPQYCEWCNP